MDVELATRPINDPTRRVSVDSGGMGSPFRAGRQAGRKLARLLRNMPARMDDSGETGPQREESAQHPGRKIVRRVEAKSERSIRGLVHRAFNHPVGLFTLLVAGAVAGHLLVP